MNISNIKRMFERNWLADIMAMYGPAECEDNVEGFWDIIAEYFTHM